MSIYYPRITKGGVPCYWLLCIILIIVAGFRFKLGIDTYSYTNEYKYFPKLSQLTISFIKESNYRILWILFEATCRTITSSFYFLQIVLAIFVNFAVFKFVKQYSLYPFLTILFYYLLFYLNLNMEILRESIPICIFLFGISFIINKNYFKYYILAIIAYFFHESGIILFIIPFLTRIKWDKRLFIFVITLLVIFSGLLSIYFVNYIKNLDFLFNSNKFGYFEFQSASSGNQFLSNIIKYVVTPSVVLLLFFKKLTTFEKSIIFLYILFSILSTQSFIFYRIRDYFLIPFLISVTNGFTLGVNKKFNNLISKGAFLFCFLFIFLYKYYSGNNKGYNIYLNFYPYNSILNEDLPQSRVLNFQKVYD